MALITCENCGKSVSDTKETCIHCGFPLQKVQLSQESIPESHQANENKKYDKLSKHEKETLVREFWDEDTESHKYQNKLYVWDELKECFTTHTIILLLALAVTSFIVHYIKNQSAFFMTIGMSLILGVVGFLGLVITFFQNKKLNSKTRKLAQEKRFQQWLSSSKCIDYIPQFLNIKEQYLYEQINLDLFKF